jgi:hypothetical protein
MPHSAVSRSPPCRSTHGSVALRTVAASLHKPGKWPELKSFTVIENQREVNKKRAGKALVHQQPKSKCATDWCYESRSPAVGESPALAQEYCFQRQPDVCTLRPPPPSQPGHPRTRNPELDPHGPGQTEGRHQGKTDDCSYRQQLLCRTLRTRLSGFLHVIA